MTIIINNEAGVKEALAADNAAVITIEFKESNGFTFESYKGYDFNDNETIGGLLRSVLSTLADKHDIDTIEIDTIE